MDKETKDWAERQSDIVDKLLNKVAALEFCVFALSASHPDKKALANEVDKITKVLRDPPNEFWDEIARKIEILTFRNAKDEQSDGE